MGLGNTEENHRRIPDELLDYPSILRDDLGYLPEDPAHDLLDVFGVQSFTHGRITRQVCEQDRYVPSFSLVVRYGTRVPLFIKRLATCSAEPKC